MGSRFPCRLHDMLEYAERQGLDSTTISWIHNGRAFLVHDPTLLVNILPLFFELTKYRSFRRQLNMWSFQTILVGGGPNQKSSAFQHPYFVRGQRTICESMSRDTFNIPTSIMISSSSGGGDEVPNAIQEQHELLQLPTTTTRPKPTTTVASAATHPAANLGDNSIVQSQSFLELFHQQKKDHDPSLFKRWSSTGGITNYSTHSGGSSSCRFYGQNLSITAQSPLHSVSKSLSKCNTDWSSSQKMQPGCSFQQPEKMTQAKTKKKKKEEEEEEEEEEKNMNKDDTNTSSSDNLLKTPKEKDQDEHPSIDLPNDGDLVDFEGKQFYFVNVPD